MFDKFLCTNTDGKKDFVMTLTVIAFFIVSVCLVLGMFKSLTIFGHDVTLRKLEAGEIAAYMGTLFSAYVARRSNLLGNNNPSPKPKK